MQLIVAPLLPSSLNTVERQTVFDLETLIAALYSKAPTTSFPHQFVETEATYEQPIISKRQVPTPFHGMRVIYTVAFQVDPLMGFNANGVWNHVLPMAQDLVF